MIYGWVLSTVIIFLQIELDIKLTWDLLAGRGGSMFLINAPVMLSLVVGAIKRVILRPAYNKGALIEKGFLGQFQFINLLFTVNQVQIAYVPMMCSSCAYCFQVAGIR